MVKIKKSYCVFFVALLASLMLISAAFFGLGQAERVAAVTNSTGNLLTQEGAQSQWPWWVENFSPAPDGEEYSGDALHIPQHGGADFNEVISVPSTDISAYPFERSALRFWIYIDGAVPSDMFFGVGNSGSTWKLTEWSGTNMSPRLIEAGWHPENMEVYKGLVQGWNHIQFSFAEVFGTNGTLATSLPEGFTALDQFGYYMFGAGEAYVCFSNVEIVELDEAPARASLLETRPIYREQIVDLKNITPAADSPASQIVETVPAYVGAAPVAVKLGNCDGGLGIAFNFAPVDLTNINLNYAYLEFYMFVDDAASFNGLFVGQISSEQRSMGGRMDPNGVGCGFTFNAEGQPTLQNGWNRIRIGLYASNGTWKNFSDAAVREQHASSIQSMVMFFAGVADKTCYVSNIAVVEDPSLDHDGGAIQGGKQFEQNSAVTPLEEINAQTYIDANEEAFASLNFLAGQQAELPQWALHRYGYATDDASLVTVTILDGENNNVATLTGGTRTFTPEKAGTYTAVYTYDFNAFNDGTGYPGKLEESVQFHVYAQEGSTAIGVSIDEKDSIQTKYLDTDFQGEEQTLHLSATVERTEEDESDNNTVTWSVTNDPENPDEFALLSIGPDGLLMIRKPTASGEYRGEVRVTAADGGFTDTLVFTVVVTDKGPIDLFAGNNFSGEGNNTWWSSYTVPVGSGNGIVIVRHTSDQHADVFSFGKNGDTVYNISDGWNLHNAVLDLYLYISDVSTGAYVYLGDTANVPPIAPDSSFNGYVFIINQTTLPGLTAGWNSIQISLSELLAEEGKSKMPGEGFDYTELNSIGFFANKQIVVCDPTIRQLGSAPAALYTLGEQIPATFGDTLYMDMDDLKQAEASLGTVETAAVPYSAQEEKVVRLAGDGDTHWRAANLFSNTSYDMSDKDLANMYLDFWFYCSDVSKLGLVNFAISGRDDYAANTSAMEFADGFYWAWTVSENQGPQPLVNGWNHMEVRLFNFTHFITATGIKDPQRDYTAGNIGFDLDHFVSFGTYIYGIDGVDISELVCYIGDIRLVCKASGETQAQLLGSVSTEEIAAANSIDKGTFANTATERVEYEIPQWTLSRYGYASSDPDLVQVRVTGPDGFEIVLTSQNRRFTPPKEGEYTVEYTYTYSYLGAEYELSATQTITAARNPSVYEVQVTDADGNTSSTYLLADFAGDSMTLQLNADVLPAYADNKNVTWETSDFAVAAVSDTGLVTIYKQSGDKAAYSVTITAKSSENPQIRGEYTIYITADTSVTGVELDRTEIEKTHTEIGTTVQLTATVYPVYAANKGVVWSSSDSTVATVSQSGLVTLAGVGTAVITVTTEDGSFTATCSVTVAPGIQPESVSLDQTEITRNADAMGDPVQLNATISPANAEEQSLTWDSSDPTVATVSETGLVTFLASGRTTITVTTANGKQATCVVTIHRVATGISFAEPVLAFDRGDIGNTFDLQLNFTPANATNKYVTYQSSDTGVVTVDENGKITVVGVGTAVITCTYRDNPSLTATCEIQVSDSGGGGCSGSALAGGGGIALGLLTGAAGAVCFIRKKNRGAGDR